MTAEADEIASTVLGAFNKLPAKRKPVVRDNGSREWVPLAGIVVKGPNGLKCVAMATGMKCLPASKLSQVNGIALHDWHAEVLALRAFNRFILDECRRLAQDGSAESEFLRRRTVEERSSTTPWHSQPFAWREEVSLHMYCSEAPCGDASMELIMAAQADATPWTLPPSLSPSPVPTPLPTTTTTPALIITPSTTTINPPPTFVPATSTTNPQTTPSPSSNPAFPVSTSTPAPPPNNEPPKLLGRGYFTHLGIVRRKPSRADAPPSHSKSCSDKLALKQATSLLSSLPCLFVAPAGVYLATLVLPEWAYSEQGCRRCFSAGGSEHDGNGNGDGEGQAEPGRMAPLRARTRMGGGYGFAPFRVATTAREFPFSRRGVSPGTKLVASNLALAWTLNGAVDEGLIGGVLQGRKAGDVRGASLTSRRRMWDAAVEVAGMVGDEGIKAAVGEAVYDGVKEGKLLEGRRRVKEEARREALKGWLRNTGDGGFSR